MSRLIDADKVDYENIMCSQAQLHWLNAIIEMQPTVDAVEVVRCKDCEKGHPELNSHCDKAWCVKFARDMEMNGFCSYGERKDNGC